MNYYFLDAVPWQQSQALYHAAARLEHEALFILRPAEPYVCIGFHQAAGQEIDLDYAARHAIPVFRREVGGGAVYLDGMQLFFQLIVRRNRKEVPPDIAGFYSKFLQPVVQTFRHFGVPAEYRPVNDITVNGRKISGTGAAQFGEMVVLVGNFIQDFNFDQMVNLLKVPDEKFRGRVHQTMQENLTTFLRETGSIPRNHAIAADLLPRFESLLGPMVPSQPGPELLTEAETVLNQLNIPAWLLANDRRSPSLREVKVSEDVSVIHKVHKAPGGLIRASAVVRRGCLTGVHLSGDFFLYPASLLPALETALEGIALDPAAILQAVTAFYSQTGAQSPGVSPQDFTSTFFK